MGCGILCDLTDRFSSLIIIFHLFQEGPSVAEMMSILGKEEATKRLHHVISSLKSLQIDTTKDKGSTKT